MNYINRLKLFFKQINNSEYKTYSIFGVLVLLTIVFVLVIANVDQVQTDTNNLTISPERSPTGINDTTK